MGNWKSPPFWEPAFVDNAQYPHNTDHYAKDVRDWVIAMEVAEHLQCQVFMFAFGGAARRFFDGMSNREKQYGVDLGDGTGGCVHVFSVEFIFGVLEAQFFVHQEARMFRTGLGLFKFMSRRDGCPEEWFQRFDAMLADANRVGHFGLSITFQFWMLLFLLQLFPKPWSDMLKDLNYRLFVHRREHVQLQQAIFREKTIKRSILDLRRGVRNVPGGGFGCVRIHFAIEGGAGPRPLFMCLGDPGGNGFGGYCKCSYRGRGRRWCICRRV